jgi:hypothetical protein
MDVKAVLRIIYINQQDWQRPVSKIAVSVLVINDLNAYYSVNGFYG